nr:hypothetical protein [Deefgea sp. CFH1-16]
MSFYFQHLVSNYIGMIATGYSAIFLKTKKDMCKLDNYLAVFFDASSTPKLPVFGVIDANMELQTHFYHPQHILSRGEPRHAFQQPSVEYGLQLQMIPLHFARTLLGRDMAKKAATAYFQVIELLASLFAIRESVQQALQCLLVQFAPVEKDFYQRDPHRCCGWFCYLQANGNEKCVTEGIRLGMNLERM